MKELEHLDIESINGTKINLDALYQIMPSAFTETRDEKTGELRKAINFNTLRELLGDDAVDKNVESYEFTWVGKQAARAEAARPTDKTLRPVPEDSLDWDKTKNIYIEGDNLEVLKLLQKSYMGKVKMIYIDPPYNTGNDFVYHDDFSQDVENYRLESGETDEFGNKFVKNPDSNGRFHSDWCSMIYSRLLVARSLLSEEGVIFISIDDNEVENLRKLGNEVFGENNFVANLIWKSKSGGANDSRFFAVDHEYVMCYAREATKLGRFMDKDAEVTTSYNLKDENGEYSLDRLDKQSLGYIESLDFPIVGPDGKVYVVEHKNPIVKVARWRWSKETVAERYNELVFKNGYVYTKNYKKSENIARSLLYDDRFGRTRTGKTDFTAMFEAAYFSAPKPVKLIYFLSSIIGDKNSIILDFFSGSATTAHAVMQLNSEDDGNRRFIMVQLPEKTEEKSEAYKAGYENICEIGKERIRRAGKKIKAESPLTTADLDTGFRVFRLGDSYVRNVAKSPKQFSQGSIEFDIDNINRDGYSDMGLLFECMIKWGVQLSLPMAKETVDGCDIYNVNDGDLVACFSDNITDEVVKTIAAKNPLRVVFRDSCFNRDDAKINIFETFKQMLDWSDDEVVKNVRVI